MAHDVFVSYSTHDKAVADAVCGALEAHGIRCWIAPRDITPGMDWSEAIIDAIHSSRVMILVFSSHANESQQVRREVERAAHRGVLIMPLRIDNVTPTRSLAYFIGPVHWLDALTPPLEGHLQNLAEAVRLVLSRLGPDGGTIETQKSPGENTQEGGRQVGRQQQGRTQPPVPSAWGRFKKTVITVIVVGFFGVGLTFYGLWHRVDQGAIWEEARPQKEAPDIQANKVPGQAEETKQRGGEAACYDEAAVDSLVVSLQKTTEAFNRNLISVYDLNSRRKKLLDDLTHLMTQGPSTEACLAQELVLMGSLFVNGFIDIYQWNSSRGMLWKALHDLLLAKVQSEEDRLQALVIINQLFTQGAINIYELNATRKELSEK